jgi:DNA polymerase elongation subunit (family B)/predicted RNA-binding Zn-ribbon protein involved in translation (DUF1610 family)
MSKPKVLFFDIETSANEGHFWGNRWEQNIIEITKYSDLLSFAWKLNQSKTKCLTRAGFQDKTDKSLCKMLKALLNSADIVVGHNCDAFDVKKLNARLAYHNLKPVKPLVTVDTKKVAKRYFNFVSNSLDDLGEYLGLGRKYKHSGYDLWKRCVAGEKTAFTEMAKYNKVDVDLLEKVYLRLKPHMHNHPSIALLEGNKDNCPSCGSANLQKRGLRATHASIKQQYVCKDCGSWTHKPIKKVKK